MAIRPEGVRGDGAALRALLDLPPGPPEAITGVTLDSRAVLPGDLYAALPGFTTHGARFAGPAAAAGAAAVLTDASGLAIIEAAGGLHVPVLVVADPRGVLGRVAAWLYGEPASAVVTTGITGTNGKTTVAFLLDAALRATGRTTGLMGTVATQIGDQVLPSVRTTPEAPDVHALLAVMRQRGATAVTMEVSSHALALGRVDGVLFDLAVFTNLSQDHLDFHGDMEHYFAAKADLFTPQRSRAALVNVDDAWGQRLAARAREAGLPTSTYAVDAAADWSVSEVRPGDTAVTGFTAHGPGGLALRTGIGLVGRFNVANALAALAAAVHHGVDPQLAAAAIAACPGVPGRMERVDVGQPFLAVVDYAHTPDAVARAIAAAREVVPGGARILTVLGCGGDRDRDKRPVMGELAARESDILVITDDNPRSESALAIREAIMAGVARVDRRQRAQVLVEGDRARAIGIAAGMAGPGDVLLVLGKGHEQGQEVAGVVTPFDDRVALRAAMEGLQ
ncbi:MAG TPA: UDP-N-acetylmuramoyl-L-alanyl-D-glutamate--2,6-diaminopimelate ligase [Candidatus Nanopelagicales bacterium]